MASCALYAILGPALAQSDVSLLPEGSSEMQVGAVLVSGPRAPGSAGRSTVLLPQFSAEWSNGVFLDGLLLGKQMSSDPRLQYGPLLAFNLAAQHGDNGRTLRPVLGAFIRYRPVGELRLQGHVIAPASDAGNGVLMQFSAGTAVTLASHQWLNFSLGIEAADSAYMQSDFGTARFHPSGGLRTLFASVHWDWELSPKVRMALALHASRLQGDAAASPRTERRNGVANSLSFRYSF